VRDFSKHGMEEIELAEASSNLKALMFGYKQHETIVEWESSGQPAKVLWECHRKRYDYEFVRDVDESEKTLNPTNLFPMTFQWTTKRRVLPRSNYLQFLPKDLMNEVILRSYPD